MIFSPCLSAQNNFQEGINYFNNKQWDKVIEYFSHQLEFNNNSPLPYHYLGVAYLETSKPNLAYDILSRGLLKFPKEKVLVGNFLNAGILLKKFDTPINYAIDYLKTNPNDNEIKKLLSIAYLQQSEENFIIGKFEKAIEFARLAKNYNPKDENIYYLMIYSLISLNKNKEAINEAEKSLKLFPNSTKILEPYFSALLANNEYEKALNIALKLNNKFSDNLDFQIQLGMLYRYNFKIEEATKHFEKLISRFNNQEKVYDSYISFLETLNQFDKIREVYNLKIKKFGKEDETILNIYETYNIEKKPYQAREVLYEYLNKKENSIIRLELARNYYINNILDSSLIHLKLIPPKEKEGYDALKLILVIYSSLKNQDSLFNYSKLMLDQYKDDFYAHYFYSKALYIRGDFTTSRLYAESAIQINKDNPYPYDILAEIFLLRGENNESEKNTINSIDKCIISLNEMEKNISLMLYNLDPKAAIKKSYDIFQVKNELEALKQLLSKNFDRLKKLKNKNELITETITLLNKYPKNAYLKLELANIYFENKNLDSAEILLRNVLENNANIYEAHKTLARIYEMKENYSEQIKSLKRVLSIKPDDNDAYDDIIRISLKNGSQNELANEWMKIYKTDKSNTVLRERLIELLHKSNRFDEARELIQNY